MTTTAPFTFGPRGLAFGTIVASTPPAAIVAVASPVYPAGSPAARSDAANRAAGHGTYRYFTQTADGDVRGNLWHDGNSVCTLRAL